MTTRFSESLEAQIERVVREHMATQRLAATAALERAFAAASSSTGVVQRGRTFHRRPPTEVAELAERLFQAVQACPGETMAALAPRVGEKPRALHRPMAHLKVAGRVRSAGKRNSTRYFPMAAGKA